MYIRLRLNGYYTPDSQVDRVINRALPIQLDRFVVSKIKPLMSPEAWSVYCTLYLYESIKYETKVPPLEVIYEENFKSTMTKAQFNAALNELETLRVNGEPILEFLDPDEELEELSKELRCLFTQPDKVEAAIELVKSKIRGRG